MKCSECNAEVIKDGRKKCGYRLADPKLLAAPNNIPFYCTTCGAFKWRYRAIRSVAFIWPCAGKKIYGTKGLIQIPQEWQEDYKSDFGILLSLGPGHWDNKRFYPTNSELKPGMRVVYDKTVPWSQEIKGNDGLRYTVKMMDYKDIRMYDPK